MRQAYQRSQCAKLKLSPLISSTLSFDFDLRFLLESARVRNQLLHALFGSGTAQGGIDQKVGNLLKAHGVPDSALSSRVRHVLEQISHEKLQHVVNSRDSWTQLKREANAIGLRLLDMEESTAFHAKQKQLGDDEVVRNDLWKRWQGSSAPAAKPTVEARLRAGVEVIVEAYKDVSLADAIGHDRRLSDKVYGLVAGKGALGLACRLDSLKEIQAGEAPELNTLDINGSLVTIQHRKSSDGPSSHHGPAAVPVAPTLKPGGDDVPMESGVHPVQLQLQSLQRELEERMDTKLQTFQVDLDSCDHGLIQVEHAVSARNSQIERLDASSREQSASILRVLQGMQAAQSKTDQQQVKIMDMLQRMAPADRPVKAARET
eukprot:s3132_g11.t1